VQVHVDIELAGVAQRAFAHHHFALLERVAGGAERLGDVARPDRAEQLAFRARVRLDGHVGAFERGLARLGRRQDAIGLGLVFAATLLELGEARFGRRRRLALRHEVVAAVARLDVDLVAEVAEVLDFLQKDQLHDVLRFVSAGKPAQLVAVRMDGVLQALSPKLRLEKRRTFFEPSPPTTSGERVG
jgi:hypothetical protein